MNLKNYSQHAISLKKERKHNLPYNTCRPITKLEVKDLTGF